MWVCILKIKTVESEFWQSLTLGMSLLRKLVMKVKTQEIFLVNADEFWSLVFVYYVVLFLFVPTIDNTPLFWIHVPELLMSKGFLLQLFQQIKCHTAYII